MKEIIIYPNPENSNYDKGMFFEVLVSKILRNQRYKVKERINFTGMEIDLLCEHIDRQEIATVECKAKDNLSSTEIKNFAFNVSFKKMDYGFFLYTKYYQHQVGGLIEEIKKDERFKNVYFWDCEKIIDLLIDTNDISKFNLTYDKYRISKVNLLYSYFGVFYVVLLSNSTISEYFSVYDAKSLQVITELSIIENIQKIVKDVNTLKIFNDNNSQSSKPINFTQEDTRLEVVAEIQESESWDDFKPASTKFFVGRKNLKEQLFIFFDNVQRKETNNRVFYLDGKSGWGKSSLINELKGRSRNRYYKNRYFLFAVDSRSATSSNFVAFSFKRMVEDAEKTGFIKLNSKKLVITSNYDVLASDSVKEIFEELESQQKVFILVFDQFEDVFRKGDLFKAFYKLLLDARNYNTNLIIGFSWKSEIHIPITHEAYYLWQQSMDYTYRISMPEFDYSESKEIINQLEKSINQKLDNEFTRKIADNSQGFPWLVKKLCVHIFKQININTSVATLYEQDFNVETLFKEDLEGLSPDENRALIYIAKRAYEDNSFDATETDEVISTNIIESLVLHRKLVIKSGSKYNIYWDIFRDYLVTKEVPKIGETYLIRQNVPPVLEMYLLFSESSSLTLDEISNLMLIKEGTILNSLRLLKDIGLLQVKNDIYTLRINDLGVSEEDFKQYLHDKLMKHTLVLEIQKKEGVKIDLSDLAELIKTKFKSTKYSDQTLRMYAQYFINWLRFAEIDIPQISSRLRLEAQNLTTFTPQNMPLENIDFYKTLEDEQNIEISKKIYKCLYDLKSIGLISYFKSTIYLSTIGKDISHNSTNEKELLKNICLEALKTYKINKAYQVYNSNPNINVKEFKHKIHDLLIGINSVIYQTKTNRVLYNWSILIHENI